MPVSATSVRLIHTLALCAPLLLTACGGSQAPAEPPATEAHDPAAHAAPLAAGWTATDGIETPESVYVDVASGFIFASKVTHRVSSASTSS